MSSYTEPSSTSGSHIYTDEPRHEKTGFCLCENKDADQLCSNCTADQHLCFRYTDTQFIGSETGSTIPLLPKSEISSLYPSSVAA